MGGLERVSDMTLEASVLIALINRSVILGEIGPILRELRQTRGPIPPGESVMSWPIVLHLSVLSVAQHNLSGKSASTPPRYRHLTSSFNLPRAVFCTGLYGVERPLLRARPVAN